MKAVALRGVGVRMQGRWALRDVDMDLDRGEHLAVLGPNGAGKTTLLRVLATYRFPTRGRVQVLGATFGRVDLRSLRDRIGFVSTALTPLLGDRARAGELVAAARLGATAPPRGVLADPRLRGAAEDALYRVGAGHLVDRRLAELSQGEHQRVQLARALAAGQELVLLDEPFAGLDLGGRESLLADLESVLADPAAPTVVLVTHHVEEIPPAFRRALLLCRGRPVASGPVEQVLADAPLGRAFGVPVRVRRDAGRWTATVRLPGGPHAVGRTLPPSGGTVGQ